MWPETLHLRWKSFTRQRVSTTTRLQTLLSKPRVVKLSLEIRTEGRLIFMRLPRDRNHGVKRSFYVKYRLLCSQVMHFVDKSSPYASYKYFFQQRCYLGTWKILDRTWRRFEFIHHRFNYSLTMIRIERPAIQIIHCSFTTPVFLILVIWIHLADTTKQSRGGGVSVITGGFTEGR